MLNLLKKDFIVSIKGEGKSNIKYVLLFLAAYFLMNSLSYYAVPVFVSYLILANTFYNDYKDSNMNFINSIPTKKEDIVYSKYILALILIISTIVVFGLINTGLSKFYYRETVLNDIYFALSLFLIIVSVVLPLYFKFGYHKARMTAGVISIVLFIITYINLQNIAFREFNLRHPEDAYYMSIAGPFKQFIEYIIMEMDVTYINLQNLTILSGIIFIISMIVSLKIMKCKSIDIKIIVMMLITVVTFIFSSKFIFKDLIHEDESAGYLYKNDKGVIVRLDKIYESEEGIKIKIKFINNTKYIYKIDTISPPELVFNQKLNGDNNNLVLSPITITTLYPFNEQEENYKIYHNGVKPFSEESMVFTVPKGFSLDKKYFNLDETCVNYVGNYTAPIPFLDEGFVRINGDSGALNIGNIFENNYKE